ncbi:MAG TPA: hypothetical protein VKS19_12255 [Verrucomicrobiae bacterium]|nr:hypothetical protein [Verrucomicrobiae bacterium]
METDGRIVLAMREVTAEAHLLTTGGAGFFGRKHSGRPKSNTCEQRHEDQRWHEGKNSAA